jgi:hypothetical protein
VQDLLYIVITTEKMRLLKFFGVLLIACMAHVGFAQTHSEDSFVTPERTLAQSIQVFPNPSVDFVHVKVADIPASKVRLALHNILGNPMDVETEIIAENEIRVRVKDLAVGYYLLAIKDDESNTVAILKILKR